MPEAELLFIYLNHAVFWYVLLLVSDTDMYNTWLEQDIWRERPLILHSQSSIFSHKMLFLRGKHSFL